MMQLTATRLRELLEYDPETGIFRWRVSRQCIRAGAVAGTIRATGGYRQILVDGKAYRAGRLAFLWMKGHWPDCEVDHRNVIRDDDRWVNLREATRSENNRNATKKRGGVTHRLKGVTAHKSGKHVARIMVDRKRIYLGMFDHVEEAHAAYIAAARKHFGEFARDQ